MLTAASTYQRTAGRKEVFSGFFVPAADIRAAERLYRALWTGRLADLTDLVDAATASGALRNADGWLLQTMKTVRTDTMTITLLGQPFKWTKVKTADLSYKSDLAGNLLAFSGKGSVENEVTNYWHSRTAALGVTVASAFDAAQPSRVSLALSGAYTASDQDMTDDAFTAMMASMSPMTGIPPGDSRALLGIPDSNSMRQKPALKGLTITLPIGIDEAGLRAFLGRTEAEIRRITVAQALVCLDAQLANTVAFSDQLPSRELADRSRQVLGADLEGEARIARYLQNYPLGYDDMRMPDEGQLAKWGYAGEFRPGSPVQQRLRVFLRLAHVVNGVVLLASACRELVELVARATPADREATVAASSRTLEQISRALAPMAVAAIGLAGNETVPWPLATFGATMARLTGRPVPPGFIALATTKADAGNPVPLIAL
jgi:hypothetical protein